MKNKTLKLITTGCFAIIAVRDIVILFDRFNLWNLILTVGSIFVVIALLSDTPILSAVGFALWSIDTLNLLIHNFEWMLYDGLLYLVIWVANLLCFVLLMIAGINPKSAKTLGLIATSFAIVRLIVRLISSVVNRYEITASLILSELLLTAGALLIGLMFDSFSKKVVVNKAAAAHNSNLPTQKLIKDSNVERLTRLKTFLDEGVITQEEFDEKKKQLLGL